MRILFTGFTSRTVGSERNVYDYLANVDVLYETLKRAGHEVDRRTVSLTHDPCVEEDYDCALVGVAAANGLSSRFKLGALWALHKFGRRAAIFPSDGKNVGIFPASVQSCTDAAVHKVGPFPAYLLGQSISEDHVLDAQVGKDPAYLPIWRDVLNSLPRTSALKCTYPILVPTHAWGRSRVYERAWGGPCTIWDPTHPALNQTANLWTGPIGADGRLPGAPLFGHRERSWILSSLQDNNKWVGKQRCQWPVVTIGNKRKAKVGEGLAYVPEVQLIEEYYTNYAGMLAFGYPLAEGGWWRMRYLHAALAGCVTCTDPADASVMPGAFRYSRNELERFGPERLSTVALEQYKALIETAWPESRVMNTLDMFIRSLAKGDTHATENQRQ